MPMTETKKRNNAKHLAKLDRIVIQPSKEDGHAIRAAAAAAGQSTQRYILDAIAERMQRDATAAEQRHASTSDTDTNP